MNILQVNSVCGIGSTGRIACDIHNLLQSQGHQSSIAFGRGTQHNCSNAIRIGNSLDNYIHVTETRLFDRHGFSSIKATNKFISEVTKLNPDLIHLHNLHGYYLHVGLLFEWLKKANKPVVWTLHDCWAFTGHCAHFDFVGCQRWINGCHSCPLKFEYPKSYFDNSFWNYRQKKNIFVGVENLTIVSPSLWLSNLVKNSFLKEYPVKVINNGIDLNTFCPISGNFRAKFLLEKKFIILGVASIFNERKGYSYFLDLSKLLDQDEIIVLVGLNDKQIKNLPANIIGIQKTNSTSEIADIYSSADVFVNPTLEDNFPTTNIEALSCGTPVITFNSGGSPESLDESVGLVVDRGDLLGLRTAISNIKSNGKQSYSIACEEKAKRLFDKDFKFREYVNLYSEKVKFI